MYAKILANMVATSHQMNAKAEGDYIGPDGFLYKNYLEGMKNCLLELYPEIGVYKGAWTSGTIKRSEAITS